MTNPNRRLENLGIILPDLPPSPIGSFCNVKIVGNLAYVSGQGPVEQDGTLRRGKVGSEISAERAREDSKLVAINILAALRAEIGSLERVKSVVKLLGLVNAEPNFEKHPFVIDGASTFLAEVFGHSGRHARSSFGVSSLPNQITVEIEAIFELEC